jgi:hypothetical protein
MKALSSPHRVKTACGGILWGFKRSFASVFGSALLEQSGCDEERKSREIAGWP